MSEVFKHQLHNSTAAPTDEQPDAQSLIESLHRPVVVGSSGRVWYLDDRITSGYEFADFLRLGTDAKARRKAFRRAANPNLPRLMTGKIEFRVADYLAWEEGMALNHTNSGKPSRFGSPNGKKSGG